MSMESRGARARMLAVVLTAALGAGGLRELQPARPDPGERPAGLERAGAVRVMPLDRARAVLEASGAAGCPLEEGGYVAAGCQGRVRPLPLGVRRVLGLPIDLNALGEEEFQDLPGIGPALARRIVETRRRRGGLRGVEDLLEVPGIGPVKAEAVRRALHADRP